MLATIFMDNPSETNILTTRPSVRSIGFPLFGTIFFGSFSYLIWTTKWNIADNTDYQTAMTIIRIILILFVFFSAGCLLMLLSIKTICLTNKHLIIKRPLLLFKRVVSLSNINKVSKGDYKINATHRSTDYKIYKGEKTIVELKIGKRIEFNSFEISGYDTLTNNLRRLLNSNKDFQESQYEAVNINATLKRKRKQIDLADLFIAATAVTHSLSIATLNRKHFDRIETLNVIE